MACLPLNNLAFMNTDEKRTDNIPIESQEPVLIEKEKVSFSFGLIADVQFAQRNDGHNFKKTKTRRYRNSLEGLKKAVKQWNQDIENGFPLTFVGNLGDLIDGFNHNDSTSESSFKMVMDVLDMCNVSDMYHCIGNHELYNFSRKSLHQLLETHRSATVFHCECNGSSELETKQENKMIQKEIQSDQKASEAAISSPAITSSSDLPQNHTHSADKNDECECYQKRPFYSFSPHKDWVFIVLDPYFFSLIGPENPSVRYDESNCDSLASKQNKDEEDSHLNIQKEKAYEFLAQRNPNDVRSPSDWTHGVVGENRRFMPYNGAIGEIQRKWLSEELQRCEKNNRKVVIFSHVALNAVSCNNLCVIWDGPEVIDILHTNGYQGDSASTTTSVVKAVFSGHDHSGGYGRDEKGIHHLTLPSPLEAPNDSSAYASVDVYDNSLHVRGYGTVSSFHLNF